MIYFWSNEGSPLEPIHIHISEGSQTQNSAKVWILENGEFLVCSNNSGIPNQKIRKILLLSKPELESWKNKWLETFEEITYYC